MLFMLCAASGCSSAPLAIVNADVTFKDEPVIEAEVLFEPEETGSVETGSGAAFGMTNDDGVCVLDLGGKTGVTPGRYKISVTRFAGPGGISLPTGEEGAAMKQNGTARRITSVFHKELKAGPNSFTLKIEAAESESETSP